MTLHKSLPAPASSFFILETDVVLWSPMVVTEQRMDGEGSANGKWPGSQLHVESWGECGKNDRQNCVSIQFIGVHSALAEKQGVGGTRQNSG